MGVFDDKKTLLEQRWEAEAEDEETEEMPNPYIEARQRRDKEEKAKIAAYADEEDEVEGYEPVEEDSVFLSSPVCAEDVPLVLITNNNRIFVGGLLEVLDQGVVLDHPMVYVEIPDQRNPGRLQLGVQKIFHGLPVPRNMWFKHDALNMIRAGDEQATRLAAMYENSLTEVKAADSGIKAPSVAELRDYTRKDS